MSNVYLFETENKENRSQIAGQNMVAYRSVPKAEQGVCRIYPNEELDFSNSHDGTIRVSNSLGAVLGWITKVKIN